MPDAYARYSFLPWVRQGMARYLDTTDSGQTNAPARVSLPVRLRLNDHDPIRRDLTLMGPGDVAGLEAAQVIRREPERQSKSFAPNYFPFVELRSPDLPWLFTPLAPDAQNRMRPWLCLVVVVARGDGDKIRPGGHGALSQLHIADADRELPPLAESWAWAHAQVTRRADDDRPVERILAESPELAISRLICPRRLDPLTDYHACIVPAFEAGRAAALGLDPVEDLRPAWGRPGQTSVTLPIYYSWAFTTAAAGDFEALVRLLKPGPAPEGVGRRDVDISDPQWGDPADFGLPAPPEEGAAPVFATFEGALRAPDQDRASLPDPPDGAYSDRLAEILTQAQLVGEGEDPDPIVAPPLYGRWHAGRETLPGTGHWMRDLNLDPRDRAAAGLGVEAVRRNQEALMHSAWQQVDRVTRANNTLRRGKVAEAVGTSFKARHLDPLTAAEVISVTYPVHAQLLMSPMTLREKIRLSAAPDRSVSPAFRRVARRGGPLARAAGNPAPEQMFGGLVSGRLQAAPIHEGFAGMATGQALADKGFRSSLDRLLYSLLRDREQALIALAVLITVLGVVLPQPIGLAALALAATLGAGASIAHLNRARWRRIALLRDRQLAVDALQSGPAVPGFAVKLDGPVAAGGDTAPAPDQQRRIEEFRAAALARHAAVLALASEPAPPPVPLSIDQTHRTLMLRLDPARMARERFAGQVTRPPGPDPDEPLDDVMAYPEFDLPMYLPLAELEQDYVLPGLQNVPTNSVTELQANRRFVEAYMAGANHEMARELRWREYPTDQRGSYFRQFWDPRGAVAAQDLSPEARRDIRPIPDWSETALLGLAGLPPGGNPERLVLLIRGELLRRFPTAQVYAQQARFEADGDRVLATEMRHPVFRGALPPDVFFLGFDFEREEATGSTDPDDGMPGWFFVIQQQPTEPRFGLDVATKFIPDLDDLSSWDELSWGHFADDPAALADLVHLSPLQGPQPVDQPVPDDIAWGRDAAGLARATLQKPVRIAIHADDLLGGG